MQIMLNGTLATVTVDEYEQLLSRGLVGNGATCGTGATGPARYACYKCGCLLDDTNMAQVMLPTCPPRYICKRCYYGATDMQELAPLASAMECKAPVNGNVSNSEDFSDPGDPTDEVLEYFNPQADVPAK